MFKNNVLPSDAEIKKSAAFLSKFAPHWFEFEDISQEVWLKAIEFSGGHDFKRAKLTTPAVNFLMKTFKSKDPLDFGDEIFDDCEDFIFEPSSTPFQNLQFEEFEIREILRSMLPRGKSDRRVREWISELASKSPSELKWLKEILEGKNGNPQN